MRFEKGRKSHPKTDNILASIQPQRLTKLRLVTEQSPQKCEEWGVGAESVPVAVCGKSRDYVECSDTIVRNYTSGYCIYSDLTISGKVHPLKYCSIQSTRYKESWECFGGRGTILPQIESFQLTDKMDL